MAKMAPPQHGPDLAIVIAPHKPEGVSGSKRMPPPGQDLQHSSAGKASPEEAGVIRSGEHCIDCQHYDASTGECEKVEGTFDPSDGCVKYFEPLSGGDKEPDASDPNEAEEGESETA